MRRTIVRHIQGKDPRSIKNHTKKKILQNLDNCLHAHGIKADQVNVKNWIKDTPVTKNVHYLLETLFQMIDDNFELKYVSKNNKRSIDHVNLYDVISFLGYEGRLKKNDLHNLLPHSWNSCLLAIDLLIEMINYVDKRKDEKPDASFVNQDRFNEYDQYLREIYPLFLNGSDSREMETIHRLFLDRLKKDIALLEDNNQRLQTKIHELENRLKSFRDCEGRFRTLRLETENQKREQSSVKTHLNDLINEVREINQTSQRKQQQLYQLKSQNANLEQNISLLNKRIQFKQLSKEEILRLKEEYNQSRSEFEAINKRLGGKRGEKFEMQSQIEEMNQNLSFNLEKYENLIRLFLNNVEGINESFLLDRNQPLNPQLKERIQLLTNIYNKIKNVRISGFENYNSNEEEEEEEEEDPFSSRRNNVNSQQQQQQQERHNGKEAMSDENIEEDGDDDEQFGHLDFRRDSNMDIVTEEVTNEVELEHEVDELERKLKEDQRRAELREHERILEKRQLEGALKHATNTIQEYLKGVNFYISKAKERVGKLHSTINKD